MRRTTDGNLTGIRWKFTPELEDLDFADDVALMSSTRKHMQNKSKKLEEVWLKINIENSIRDARTLQPREIFLTP